MDESNERRASNGRNSTTFFPLDHNAQMCLCEKRLGSGPVPLDKRSVFPTSSRLEVGVTKGKHYTSPTAQLATASGERMGRKVCPVSKTWTWAFIFMMVCKSVSKVIEFHK